MLGYLAIHGDPVQSLILPISGLLYTWQLRKVIWTL